MSKKKSLFKNLERDFESDRQSLGHFFLGVGLIMFILNITTILNFIYMKGVSYPMTGYFVSIASSFFLMGYSMYNIYTKLK